MNLINKYECHIYSTKLFIQQNWKRFGKVFIKIKMANPNIPIKVLLERIGLDLTQVNRYFKIHTTVIEMLKDRGFIIPADEEKQKLVSFIEHINKKKNAEDLVSLFDLLNELVEDKLIAIENPEILEDFVENYGAELVAKMDPQEISEKIQVKFKVPTKSGRLLLDSVNIWVGRRKDINSIENLAQIYKKPEELGSELICVYYFYNSESAKKENKRRINDVVLDLLNIQKKNKSLKNILFISEGKLNTVMIDDLKKYKEKMNISIFLGDNLVFNCTKHFLVPKHILLTEEQKLELIKETKEKNLLARLPKIFDSDPIARYFGAVPGQVFKIEREALQDDLMTRFSEFYRVVVPEVKK